jgi:hypothetical protein
MKRGLLVPGSGLAALILLTVGSACNLTLRPASSGTPQVNPITATGRSGGAETPGQETPTYTLTPTITPTFTPAAPTMTAGQELSCVKGPHWILYEWVTKIEEGETVTLLAKAAEEWEEYYWVRKSDRAECWAFGGSSTKTGDYLNLPVREAPPLPLVEYTIENKTGLRVPVVFIREKDETDWGSNRLSAILYPGQQVGLILTAGFYDVKILDVAFFPLYEEHDRPIGSEPDYRYTVLDEEYTFFVQNNHALDLCTFSFRPHGGTTWTTLHSAADGHVAPGAKVWLTLLPGIYDVAVYYCTGPMAGVITTHYVGPAIEGFNVP